MRLARAHLLGEKRHRGNGDAEHQHADGGEPRLTLASTPKSA